MLNNLTNIQIDQFYQILWKVIGPLKKEMIFFLVFG